MSRIKLVTAGESHGPGLTAILEGIPAGLQVDFSFVSNELPSVTKDTPGLLAPIVQDTLESPPSLSDTKAMESTLHDLRRSLQKESWLHVSFRSQQRRPATVRSPRIGY